MHDILLLMQTEDHPAFDKCVGICGNFTYILLETKPGYDYSTTIQNFIAYLKRKVKHWHKYSGNIAYPICTKHNDPEYDSNCDSEFEYCTNINKWADNDYGNARRELLQFLIDDLEVKINVKE